MLFHCSLDCSYREDGAWASLEVFSLSPEDLAHNWCSVKARPGLGGARAPLLHLQPSGFVGAQTKGHEGCLGPALGLTCRRKQEPLGCGPARPC